MSLYMLTPKSNASLYFRGNFKQIIISLSTMRINGLFPNSALPPERTFVSTLPWVKNFQGQLFLDHQRTDQNQVLIFWTTFTILGKMSFSGIQSINHCNICYFHLVAPVPFCSKIYPTL